MSQKITNAKNLYIKGIKEGNIETAVNQYTGHRYTQHSTGVADGKEGFINFFRGFLERTNNRDIRIIRAIEDGNFVFVHAYQDIDNGNAKWVTMDMFDTDENDKMIEHWDVIAPYVEKQESVSDNDMILGDFEILDLDKTEQNKALVRSFLVDIFQNKKYELIEHYISTKEYIQHNPLMKNGIDALKHFLTTKDCTYDFVFKVMGQGNYVISYSKMLLNNTAFAVFDIFRIAHGRIIEHWDNMEEIPPIEAWANHGKF